MARIPAALLATVAAVVATPPAAGARPDARPTCRLSAFRLQLGPWISEATGQHTLALRLVSHSASACVLNGYPSVRLSDRTGAIPFLIRHGGDQMITSRGPTPFVVRPAGVAYVVINHYRCDRGGLRAATVVTVARTTAAGADSASIRLTDPYRMPNYCGPGDPGSTLTVSPFEPTLRAALSD